MDRVIRHSRRVGIAIAGGLVSLLGFILIPYPGPGWLVVFAGLAILATEFKFAQVALDWLKVRYELWKIWVKRQPKILQIVILAFTGLVILVTIWLLNTFGLVDNFFQLNLDWLHSPFFQK